MHVGTSLGEASTRIQATDLERRKTPRVRTAPPGLRVEPKWLSAPAEYAVWCQSSDERGAAPGISRSGSHLPKCPDGISVCPGREEVRTEMSPGDSPHPEFDDHFDPIVAAPNL